MNRQATRIWTLAIGVFLGGVLCACEQNADHTQQDGRETAFADAKVARDRLPDLVDELAKLTTAAPFPEDERDRLVADIADGRLTLSGLIDDLLAREELAAEVAPRVLLGYLHIRPFAYYLPTLKQEAIAGQDTYFLRGACEPAQVEKVHPWWDMASTVRVCADSHQPRVRDDGKNPCTGINSAFTGRCGCGPNLIYCAKDASQESLIRKSILDESRHTIAHVVRNDMPLQTIFTANETFRNGYAEHGYVRARMWSGQLDTSPDLSKWSETGKWAPREEMWPGQHSGILTGHHLAYMSSGPRDRMRLLYDRAWCIPPTSFGVSVEQFQRITGDARSTREGERWQELARTPGCTSCHARMDHGMQFFAGYPSVWISAGADPSRSRHADGMGPLYGRDIDDPRGQDELTPRGFGRRLVAESEFKMCMATRVASHVFGDTLSPDERDAIAHVSAADPRFKSILRQTLALLVARYQNENPAQPSAIPASRPADAHVDADRIALSPALRSLLSEHCADCHGDGDHGFLDGIDAPEPNARISLARGQAMDMLNLTAFGIMPRGAHAMSLRQRDALVEELIAAVHASEKARALARRYYTEMAPSGVHGADTIRNTIARAAATDVREWPFIGENTIPPELMSLTPGVVAVLGVTAVRECRTKHPEDDDERRRCIVKAADPHRIVVDR